MKGSWSLRGLLMARGKSGGFAVMPAIACLLKGSWDLVIGVISKLSTFISTYNYVLKLSPMILQVRSVYKGIYRGCGTSATAPE